jgi:hypothetical protein
MGGGVEDHGLVLHGVEGVIEAGVNGGEHELAEGVVEGAAVDRALPVQEKADELVQGPGVAKAEILAR